MRRDARRGCSRRKSATLAFHLIGSLLAVVARQQLPRADAHRVDIGDITVYADQQHMALAASLGEAAAEPHQWLGIGRVDAGPLVIVLTPDRTTFHELTRGRVPEWGAGATFPARHLVVIRLDGGDPLRTLRHELAHVVLHRTVPVRVPLWFDEGYAVLAAGEFGRFAALRLNLAVATGKLPELQALDAALRGSDLDAETAYALAGSAVAEAARYGRNGKLDGLMQWLAQGVSFDSAFARSTGYTVDRFEDVWHRALRRQYNWVVWLAAGGMWLVLSVILAWAVATRRRRERPRRAALDQGWPAPPEDDETITMQDVGPPSS